MGFEFGISKERAALRGKGLIVSERFKNALEVAANGGTLTTTPPVINDGIYYGGLSKGINYNTDFQIQPEFTLSAWVYWDGNTIAEKIILGKGYDSVRTGIQFQLSASGVPECYSYIGSIYGVRSSGGAIPVNTWTFLTATRSDVNGWKIFVNGVDLSAPFGSTGAPQKPNNRFFSVGGLDVTGAGISSRWWYGQLKDVKVFQEAKTPEEILSHYNGTMWDYDKDCVLFMNGLLHEYDPDNNQHIDISINKNNLQFGDNSTASTYPTKVFGGYGFDGIDDYMLKNLGSTPDEFAISLMFNWNSNNTSNVIFTFYDSSKKYFILTKSTNTIFAGFNNKYTTILSGLYNQFNSRNVLTFIFKKDTDYVDVYLNGEFFEQKTSGTTEAVTTADVANNLFIGGATVTSQYAEATINNFAFHRTALNPTQILDLKQRMEAIYSEGRQGR